MPYPGPAVGRPDAYEVRAGGGQTDPVRVRVWRGVGLVRPFPMNGYGRAVRVRAGEEVTALCPRRHCVLTPVRLFQPGEPWTSPPVPKPERFRTVIDATGALPRSSALAPPSSSVQSKLIPASRGEPEQ